MPAARKSDRQLVEVIDSLLNELRILIDNAALGRIGRL